MRSWPSWPRAQSFVGKLTEPPGTAPPLAPPTLIATLVSGPGQRFRLTADNGEIDESTVIAEVTVTAQRPGGPLDFAISNRSTASFEVNTQEHGPIFQCSYFFGGIQSLDGRTFLSTRIIFVIGANDSINFWIQLTP